MKQKTTTVIYMHNDKMITKKLVNIANVADFLKTIKNNNEMTLVKVEWPEWYTVTPWLKELSIGGGV